MIEYLKATFDKQMNALAQEHQQQLYPLLQQKNSLKQSHQAERNALIHKQQVRQKTEQEKRYHRIQKGFRQFTSQLSGRYWRDRKNNEKEAWQSHLRDQKERDQLIVCQLNERQQLQEKLHQLEQIHTKERQAMIAEISHSTYLKQDHEWGNDMPGWAHAKPPYEHDITHDFDQSM
ncbi:hypothetical protein AB835_12135 [Candidatus Endobugula sertula]|uniref:Uncharacterized protein n=1 Tax=Candidatus Endobugula sertula TaxID=62101 RepID=A0A1D2QMM6_9GAMM|nr:hypothetical protein AB835_12135 [Candidatus Endobugula sertula]